MTDHRHHHSILTEYLTVLRRRKWIVLQAVVLIPAVAFAVSRTQPSEYEASAEILLSRANISAAALGLPDPTAYQDPTRLAQTQAQLARVPAVAELAVRGVDGVSAGRLLSESSVSPRGNSDLLIFSVTDRDPELAATLATAYAKAYTDYRSNLDSGAVEQARRELKERIAELEAGGDTSSDVYQNLVDKEQQLRTLELIQPRNTLVRPAFGAAQVAPRPVRNAVLGLLAGIVIAIGLAFAAERLDKRVRSEDEVEERLGLPLLGRIPEPPRRLRSKSQLAMLEEPTGPHAETYRRLRTNLDFVNAERAAKTILVTSAVAAEGKSTTAANLGLAYARTGKRVAVVDLDLRKPSLHTLFGLNAGPGITDVALGHAELEHVAVPIPLGIPAVRAANGNGAEPAAGALVVLAAGTLPPNPSEFVGTRMLARVLARLAETADVVLLDTPPILAVGDAAVLSSRADALLLVTRIPVIKRPMLRELERVLAASPAPALGVVVTGTAGGASYYGYGYGYGYGGSAPRAERAAGSAPRVQG